MNTKNADLCIRKRGGGMIMVIRMQNQVSRRFAADTLLSKQIMDVDRVPYEVHLERTNFALISK